MKNEKTNSVSTSYYMPSVEPAETLEGVAYA
jgi:hypothetical protein